MRKVFKLTLMLLIAGTFAATLQAQNPKPFVVPELTSWEGATGNMTLSGRIVVKSEKLTEVAHALASDYAIMFNSQLQVVQKGKEQKGDIVLQLKKDKQLGNEGYVLDINTIARVTASTPQGVYWATRTILQISEQAADKSLPCGKTTDVPAYGLRGFVIDCGRKYIPLNYLESLTKIMSYYKMNTLQVHLNDNGFRQFFSNEWDKTQAAFRLESTTYPGLTAKDGHYSKQDFKKFQKESMKSFVEIIPEIDIPAHSLAFSHYRPSLGSKEYGMDHLDLFNPEVYPFFDSLFAEYCTGADPVFCGPRVHIGTDEYSNRDKAVVEKFREFTDHYIRLVESYGKQAVCWGALTHAKGDTPVKSKDVIMDIWYNGYADPAEMKKLGYKLISIPDGYVYIVPAAGYYYDYLNCQHLYENWTPAQIGNQKFEEGDPSIMGGMFAVWNDHVGNGISVKDIHHRAYPALQTLATKCWSATRTQLPYADFDRLRNLLSEAPGIDELGRWGHGEKQELVINNLQPNQELDKEEVGYNYTVSFNIETQKEEKGTVLFKSKNAVVYLSDPTEGKLAFERDGYINRFNYTLPEAKTVQITVMGDAKSTRLLVDGEVKEVLNPLPLYVMKPNEMANFQTNPQSASPVVYAPRERMMYQRTLFFPLRHAGNFKSKITNLRVCNYWDKK